MAALLGYRFAGFTLLFVPGLERKSDDSAMRRIQWFNDTMDSVIQWRNGFNNTEMRQMQWFCDSRIWYSTWKIRTQTKNYDKKASAMRGHRREFDSKPDWRSRRSTGHYPKTYTCDGAAENACGYIRLRAGFSAIAEMSYTDDMPTGARPMAKTEYCCATSRKWEIDRSGACKQHNPAPYRNLPRGNKRDDKKFNQKHLII